VNCHQCEFELFQQLSERFPAAYACPEGHGLAMNFNIAKEGFNPGPFLDLWKKAEEGRSGKKCPSCNQQMREADFTVMDTKIAVDVCRPCYLVWFDEGEYEKVHELRQKHADVLKAEIDLAELEYQASYAQLRENLRMQSMARQRAGMNVAYFMLALASVSNSRNS
jgi:Zn-finger nucleic acid-binding protein